MNDLFGMSTDQHIRLEIMKVAYRPDKDVELNITRIDELSKFVIEGKKPAELEFKCNTLSLPKKSDKAKE